MSVEEYLNLTTKDIQYLLSINAGDYVPNPWSGSVISKLKKQNQDFLEDEEIDDDNIEISEEIETFFEEFFPDEFDDHDLKIDLDFEP